MRAALVVLSALLLLPPGFLPTPRLLHAEEAVLPGPFGPRLVLEAGGVAAQATRPELALGGATGTLLGPLALAGELRLESLYSYGAYLGAEAALPLAAAPGGRLALRGAAGIHAGFGRIAGRWTLSPAPRLGAGLAFDRGGLGLAGEAAFRFYADAAALDARLCLFAEAPAFAVLAGLDWARLFRRDGAASQAELAAFVGLAFHGR